MLKSFTLCLAVLAAISASTFSRDNQACDGEPVVKAMTVTKICGWGATQQAARDAAYFNVPGLPPCGPCEDPEFDCGTYLGFQDSMGDNIDPVEYLRPAPGGGFNCCYILGNDAHWNQTCKCDG